MLIVLDPGHTDKVNQGGHPSYYEGTEMYYFSHILIQCPLRAADYTTTPL